MIMGLKIVAIWAAITLLGVALAAVIHHLKPEVDKKLWKE